MSSNVDKFIQPAEGIVVVSRNPRGRRLFPELSTAASRSPLVVTLKDGSLWFPEIDGPLVNGTVNPGGGLTAKAQKSLGDVVGHPFHGNQWTEGASLAERLSQPDAGFTYQTTTGTEPTTGYVLSTHKDREKSINLSQLKLSDLVDYVNKNSDLLTQSQNYLGAWHDPASHKVYLDVSTVVNSAEKATQLAQDHDQLAYFDLSTGKSVPVSKRLKAAHHGRYSQLETNVALNWVNRWSARQSHRQRSRQAVCEVDGTEADGEGDSGSRNSIVALGDLPGHEFHGNQWTDGAGTSLHEILSSKKISGPLGTNPGGIYEVQSQKYYVKQYADPRQAYGEHLANQIYHDLGVGAPQSTVATVNGTTHYASKFLEGQGTLQDVGLTHERAQSVLNGFAADAFLANWDAVGTGMDNILVHQNGTTVSRIDNGGALLHRAQGALKDESKLRTVSEWQTLAQANRAPYYAKVFKAAGLPNADALQHRALVQIDRITQLQSQSGGWQKYVDTHIPQAPAEYRSRVASVLESRTKDLATIRARIAKTIETKTLAEFDEAKHPRVPAGSPGGGQFTSGDTGGSSTDTGGKFEDQAGDVTFVKKAPINKTTPDALAKAWEMKKAGKSVNEIEKETGLKKGAQWYHFKILKAKEAAIKEELTKKPNPVVVLPNPMGTVPANITDVKAYDPAKKAEEYGYVWKEKTYGPNKGKYAWFQGEMQVSPPMAKDQAATAATQMHYGTGPKAPAPAEIDVHAPASQWPIDQSVERYVGSNYQNVVRDLGAEWETHLSSDERSAIQSYTGSGHYSVNEALRSTNPDDVKTYKSKIARIESGLNKAPLPPPPDLVWRGLGGNGAAQFANASVGDELVLKGFQSTSISPVFAHHWGDTVLEIRPKKGGYVDTFSEHNGEKEFLLPHGHKYTVKGIAYVTFKGDYGGESFKRKVIQLEMH